MRVIRMSYGVRGSVRLNEYALRWAHMITKYGQKRARILAFWDKHGLLATMEAFEAKRSTLYAWKKQLKNGGGKLEALNPGSTAPKKKRSRRDEWPMEIKEEIKRLRTNHPNLGPDKVHVFLRAYCEKKQLRCPSARTVARLIADAGGLRVFPEKIRHNGTIVPRKRTKTPRKPKGFRAKWPGHLVTLDSIERIVHGRRRYILTATDNYSCFSFAWATTSHASKAAKEFFWIMRHVFPVPFEFVQTDNGSEFKKDFAKELRRQHLTHWKTYPRCPRMNGKTERFNRTLQEEFVDFHVGSLLDVAAFNHKMIEYLLWHNAERPHWALDLKSPVQFLVENSDLSRMWWRNTIHLQNCLNSLSL
jgi:transposase InsO family protein